MTLHQFIAKWPLTSGLFFGLTVLAASSLLSGCSQALDESDLEDGPGVYKCVSNIGREMLVFESNTFGGVKGYRGYIYFTDMGTGLVYKLYPKEDRDYNCIKIPGSEKVG